MTRLFLGVDAGNSKTDALLCDADGQVVGQGRDGNGDIYGVGGPSAAVAAVLESMRQALGTHPITDVAGAAFRLAGVDWPEDEKFWSARLAEHVPDLERYSISNDGFAPIRCGSTSGVGIAIVAGTGSAVAGRGPSGNEWSVRFWMQESLGARGIGADGLRAMFRTALGLGPPTVLTDQLPAHFGLDDVESLLHRLTAREHTDVSTATLAPLVTRAAADGDQVALDVVRQHADRLADYALVTARRVGFDVDTAVVDADDVDADVIPVVLAGSVLVSEPPVVADAVRDALADRLPSARPRVATLPPVAGAALDALAEAGIAITDRIVSTMSASMVPSTKASGQ